MKKSQRLFVQARRYLPGGVNSPVRAFGAVGGVPRFIASGQGSHIYDVDGQRYIDYVGSWGPLILGHAHPKVVAAIQEAAEKGTSFGAPTQQESTLAQLICEAMPSIEMVRLVNSGTEAAMSAVRLARAFTGRDKIVKFQGCYHGHADGLLVEAGSGVATLSIPGSAGVPEAYVSQTLVAPYNDLPAVEELFGTHRGDFAAVIVEPIAANMGVVPPKTGFLQGLRNLTRASGALLIFDEVITGFRVAYGGAQALYGVEPDLTCLGKIIGGGLPVGAYGGRREIMEMVAPLGPVYQAGTLSGNPLAVTAGIATLKELHRPRVYEKLEEKSAWLADGLTQAGRSSRWDVRVQRTGSILTMFFSAAEVGNFASARTSDTSAYSRFFHQMLRRGVYLPPSQFEAMFLSLRHQDTDISNTVTAACEALR